MEEILWRFPHIGKKIFKNLSNKNLVKCKMVSKSWNDFIINQKFYQQRVHYEKLREKNWRKVEKRMEVLDLAIRDALHFAEPDMAKSLILMKELQSLAIQPLMLKKLPEIVMTLSKVRNYIGPWTQESDPKLHEKRLEDIQNIRLAADTAFKKIQSLFNTPPDVSFIQYFRKMVEDFQIATKDYKKEEFFLLTVDPTTDA